MSFTRGMVSCETNSLFLSLRARRRRGWCSPFKRDSERLQGDFVSLVTLHGTLAGAKEFLLGLVPKLEELSLTGFCWINDETTKESNGSVCVCLCVAGPLAARSVTMMSSIEAEGLDKTSLWFVEAFPVWEQEYWMTERKSLLKQSGVKCWVYSPVGCAPKDWVLVQDLGLIGRERTGEDSAMLNESMNRVVQPLGDCPLNVVPR